MMSTSQQQNTMKIFPETTPLYPSSVYTFPSLDDVRAYYAGNADSRYLYRRSGHPNEQPVEAMIAELEGAESACLCASGMAAISQACMAHLKPGDHIIATKHFYGGTFAMFENILKPWGIEISYGDLNDVAILTSLVRPNTKLIFAESIANPLLQVADLESISRFARDFHLKLFVDNTFATPLLVKPLQFGATLTIHSLTKFLNGHSDVVGGVVAGAKQDVGAVRRFATTFGGTLDPFDAWQTERGLQTLTLRFSAQCKNAALLASFLEGHPAVRAVHYPGLESHSHYNVAKKMLRAGFGAMLSFSLKGGYEAANEVVRQLHLVVFAPSLGGVHTTVSHPALTSHRAYSEEERAALGIDDGLLRVSVGIEPFEDIRSDFAEALALVE